MRIAIALLLVSFLAGSAAAEDLLTPSPKPAVDATEAFGIALYPFLRKEGENTVFSPWSVSSALAMVRVGARGKTASQMDRVLCFRRGVAPAVHRALREALRPCPLTDGWGRVARKEWAFELSPASALWVKDGFAIDTAFVSVLRKNFDGHLGRLDFRRTEEARSRINDRIGRETRDRIRDIVPAGCPGRNTRIALTIAVHFKAAWSRPFNAENSAEAPFTLADGTVVNASLMRGHLERCAFAEDAGVQVASFPCRGEQASMIVVLPKKTDGLVAVEESLTPKRLRALMNALKPRCVDVALPKFRCACHHNLKEQLPRMGMVDAFQEKRADFTGISGAEPLFLSDVFHKTFLVVEEGGVGVAARPWQGAGAGKPRVDRIFRADHPFLFFIRHEETGALLFMGCVENPEAW